MGSETKNSTDYVRRGENKGATKFGRAWAIPTNADKPTDNRIITGKYKDWRRCQTDNEE